MATNVAKIQAELDLDSGKFHGTITSAVGQLKTFNAAVSNTDKSLKNIERRVTGLGASLRDTMVVLGQFRAAMHTLWMFSGQWVGSIVEANAKLERLQQLMKGLSKSTTEAGRVADALRDMNYVLDKSKNAPFAIDTIADAFVKLKASGIDPTKGSLDALTDAVAHFGGSSENLHRATIAIQQMSGKGVISMEELRQQLGEAVPNAMQLMARATGMSMAQLVKTISTGRLEASSALQKLFVEMKYEFSGSSQEMMTTWTGMVQKLKTEWLIFAKEIGEQGLFDSAKQSLNDLMRFMGSNEGKAFARDIGIAIGEAAKAAAELIQFLIRNRQEIVEWGKLIAMIFVASKITQFGMALATTSVQIVNWTRTLGGLTVAMNAARAGTISWSSAIGAAAGPIGIAITAITSLIFYLNEQYKASIRAGDAIQDYYNRTARGQAVLPEEHKAMQERLDYLRRVKKLSDEVAAYQNGDDKSVGGSISLDRRANALMAEGRKHGFVQDAENYLSTGLKSLSDKSKFMVQMYQANVAEAVRNVTNQQLLQNAAKTEEVVRNYGQKLEEIANKTSPELKGKLSDLFDQMNSGKISNEAYQAKRNALLGGVMDDRIARLTASGNELKARYANLQYNEEAAKGVLLLMQENDKQLMAAKEERAGLTQSVTLLPKMGQGGDKKQTDEFKNLYEQLIGKNAELQAKLDGGIPKLERFRELMGAGALQGNKGLADEIERAYIQMSKLTEEVKNNQIIEKIKDDLSELGASADAQLLVTNLKNAGGAYEKIAPGLANFHKQVAVLREQAIKAKMPLADFEAQVKVIAATLTQMDMANFKKYATDTAWEAYLASLPEKTARLAAFNKEVEDWNKARASMIAQDPTKAQEINDNVDMVLEAKTMQFNRENMTEWERWIDQYSSITEEMDSVWANALEGMSDKFTEFAMTGKMTFKDLIKDILAQIVKLLISKAVAQLAQMMATNFVGGYANGGIASAEGDVTPHAKGGVFGPQGTVPLRAYARGGVAKSPQLALFGEGSLPEAYVPLPDGRSIPVTVEGQGGGTVNQVSNSVSIAVTVNNDGSSKSDSNSDSAQASELGKILDVRVRQVMAEEMRPGGTLWKMRTGG